MVMITAVCERQQDFNGCFLTLYIKTATFEHKYSVLVKLTTGSITGIHAFKRLNDNCRLNV